MYSVSASFITAIKSNTREIEWSGSVTTIGGTTYLFNETNISGSGSITRKISTRKLDIGSVCAGSLSIELIMPGVSRYELYGASISLSVSVPGIADVVPMGVFTISEVKQTSDHINIKAYDNMLKFDDVDFSAVGHTTLKLPFKWIQEACTACGVSLGNTQAQIGAFPNGQRKTGFADVVTDVKTWRDVLGYITSYIGAYSYIGRDGKLYVKAYKAASDDTIPSTFRYSSKLSDYRTTYDGIYGTYKDGGLQEYVGNANTGGLVLDLGVNPFLQFTDSTNRKAALKEIIDTWNGIYYVPYDAGLPLVPYYDPGDVLTFTDNQAGAYDYGCITEITYKTNGTMSVKCSGDNPKLAAAQDRFTKSVAGLSKDYNNGQELGGKNFWLLHTENDQVITIANTATLVDQIEWDQTVDVQRMGFMFTCEADVDTTGIMKVLITVDDSIDYQFEVTESKTTVGKRIFTATCGYRVTDKGTHTAKVYMTLTASPLLWSDLV